MEKCDCLNDCGDDHRLREGSVEPCDTLKRERERQRELSRLRGIVDDLPGDTILRLQAGSPTSGDCAMAAAALHAAKMLRLGGG
jgi:hypothetical protein